ncbi:TIGR00289 family protein [Candidatus Woesearchaeota archaeon]|nr:TIGR00289 family protein [Candidatus Woesearchaeota archaeon]
MRIAVLFSGGKDSTFALYWAVQQGWDVKCLVSLMPSRADSWMFHTPNIQFVKVQAEALGLPIVIQATSGEKEAELDDLKKALQTAKEKYNIEGVVVGALASDYQQERVNRICEDLKLKTYAPLWHKDQKLLLQEMIDCGFEIIIQHIAAEGLSEKWLGRKLDQRCYDDLLLLHKKFGMNAAGEGGEYESFVLDGPIFKKRLVIEDAEKRMESVNCGTLVMKKLRLEQK